MYKIKKKICTKLREKKFSTDSNLMQKKSIDWNETNKTEHLIQKTIRCMADDRHHNSKVGLRNITWA